MPPVGQNKTSGKVVRTHHADAAQLLRREKLQYIVPRQARGDDSGWRHDARQQREAGAPCRGCKFRCEPRGYAELSAGDEPGLGVDKDEELAAKYPYQRPYLPVDRLEEGTMTTNW
jgi:hypothetical protein